MGLLDNFIPVQRTGEGSYLKQQFPSLYGALAGLLGTAPDEMGGTVLDPNTLAAKKAAEYTYLPGLLANVAPVGKGAGVLAGIAGMTKAAKGEEALSAILNAKKFVYPQEQALLTAQRNAAKPISEGGLGLRPDNTPMERAQAMPEFQKRLWQGMNKDVNGTPTKGNWYTNSPEAGIEQGYLTNRPVASEFRGPSSGYVSEDFGKTWGKPFLNDVASLLDKDGAEKLLKFSNGEPVSHGEMMQFLSSYFGGGGQGQEAALNIYNATKAKTKGFSGSDITLLHPTTPVRYSSAAFDPLRRGEFDPLAGIFAAPVGLLSPDNHQTP